VIADEEGVKRALKSVNIEKCIYLNYPLDASELQHVLFNISTSAVIKKEVLEKEKHLMRFEVFDKILRKTLSYQDEDKLLWEMADLIQEKLGLYNVSIFLIDQKTDNIVLKAFAGGLSDDLFVDYSLRMGEGLAGWVVKNRQSLVSDDVRNESGQIHSFRLENKILSEMAVPIIYENNVLGVLHAESIEKDAFSPEDLTTFETVADQMSLAFEKLRLSRALQESKKLSETINDSLPVSILILDREFKIEYANFTFCEINDLKREEILQKPFQHFLSEELLEKFDLSNELERVIDYGISINHSNIRHTSPYHPDKILNITFSRVRVGKYPRIMVLIQDVTEFTQRTYQLLLLHEISLAMEGVVERNKLLHLILTCVTVGFSMGFSRAFLFLVDDEREKLQGIMGVGPSSYKEAYKTWNELSRQVPTLQDYLNKINSGDLEKSTLQHLVESITFNLKTADNVIIETVKTANYIHVLDAWEDTRVDDKLRKLLASDEFVTIPLIARNEVIGVLMADNAYSGRSISLESIEVLTMFGVSAAIAIEKAKMLAVLEEKIQELQKAYDELEKTQEMLIKSERLAAIGEVSARLAHEIRNPLSTIGGFAKSIPKKYEDRNRTIRNANIITEEVGRLEQILTNVLDFSKPSLPKKSLTDINKLIIKTLSMFEGTVGSKKINIVKNFDKEKLEAEFDPAQIKQVFINIFQNALSAMPEGGTLGVKTFASGEKLNINISDTGCGIPCKDFENIFEPFFTTRGKGTGLGLSISRRVIQNHGGSITINSEEGKGTNVNIVLPMK